MIDIVLLIAIVNYLNKDCKFSRSDCKKFKRDIVDTILILIIVNIVESSNQYSEFMGENIIFLKRKVKKDIKVKNSCYSELKCCKELNNQIGVNNNSVKVVESIRADNIKENKEQVEKERDIEVEILYDPELKLFENLSKQKKYNNSIIVRPTFITEVFKQDEKGKDSTNNNELVEVTEVVESVWVDNIEEKKQHEAVKKDIEVEILYHPELKLFENLNRQNEYNNSIIIGLMSTTKGFNQEENEKYSQISNTDFLQIEEPKWVEIMKVNQEQEKVETTINFIDVLKQVKIVKEKSNLNQIANTIKRDYRGVNISTLVSDLGIITGEVIFNIKDVVSLKLSNNIIVFINSNSVLGFF